MTYEAWLAFNPATVADPLARSLAKVPVLIVEPDVHEHVELLPVRRGPVERFLRVAIPEASASEVIASVYVMLAFGVDSASVTGVHRGMGSARFLGIGTV